VEGGGVGDVGLGAGVEGLDDEREAEGTVAPCTGACDVRETSGAVVLRVGVLEGAGALDDGVAEGLGADDDEDEPGVERAAAGPDAAWVGASRPRHATMPSTATAAAATSIQPLNRRRSVSGTTTLADPTASGAAAAGAAAGVDQPVRVRSPE
jgi:hypothetical protein